jgi:hypothetical protein
MEKRAERRSGEEKVLKEVREGKIAERRRVMEKKSAERRSGWWKTVLNEKWERKNSSTWEVVEEKILKHVVERKIAERRSGRRKIAKDGRGGESAVKEEVGNGEIAERRRGWSKNCWKYKWVMEKLLTREMGDGKRSAEWWYSKRGMGKPLTPSRSILCDETYGSSRDLEWQAINKNPKKWSSLAWCR